MATITYTVTVASGTNQYGTGNKFYINGAVSPDLNLVEGNTYIFDQSDSTNGTGGGHPLRFSTSANGTHAGGTIHNRCNLPQEHLEVQEHILK